MTTKRPVDNTERRRVQRVRLPQPLRATVDGTRAFIVDISLQGLRFVIPTSARDLGVGRHEARASRPTRPDPSLRSG